MIPFATFDAAHLAVLALTPLAAIVLSLAVRSTERSGIRGFLDLVVFSISFGGVVLRNVSRYHAGELTLIYDLPMQLCDWAYLVLWIALVTKRQTFYELAYFWGLAGTLQSTITPVLDQGFPSVKFVQYFLLHTGIIIGAIYLTLGRGFRPRPGSVGRIFLLTQIYPLVAFPVNLLLDANYGFLMRKPEGSTLLEYVGPWPWYLISMEAIALVSFAAYYLPFYLLARGRQPRPSGGL